MRKAAGRQFGTWLQMPRRADGGLVDSAAGRTRFGRCSEVGLTGLGRIRKSLRGKGQV